MAPPSYKPPVMSRSKSFSQPSPSQDSPLRPSEVKDLVAVYVFFLLSCLWFGIVSSRFVEIILYFKDGTRENLMKALGMESASFAIYISIYMLLSFGYFTMTRLFAAPKHLPWILLVGNMAIFVVLLIALIATRGFRSFGSTFLFLGIWIAQLALVLSQVYKQTGKLPYATLRYIMNVGYLNVPYLTVFSICLGVIGMSGLSTIQSKSFSLTQAFLSWFLGVFCVIVCNAGACYLRLLAAKPLVIKCCVGARGNTWGNDVPREESVCIWRSYAGYILMDAMLRGIFPAVLFALMFFGGQGFLPTSFIILHFMTSPPEYEGALPALVRNEPYLVSLRRKDLFQLLSAFFFKPFLDVLYSTSVQFWMLSVVCAFELSFWLIARYSPALAEKGTLVYSLLKASMDVRYTAAAIWLTEVLLAPGVGSFATASALFRHYNLTFKAKSGVDAEFLNELQTFSSAPN